MNKCLATSANKACASGKKQPIKNGIRVTWQLARRNFPCVTLFCHLLMMFSFSVLSIQVLKERSAQTTIDNKVQQPFIRVLNFQCLRAIYFARINYFPFTRRQTPFIAIPLIFLK